MATTTTLLHDARMFLLESRVVVVVVDSWRMWRCSACKGPDPTLSTLPHHPVFHRQTLNSHMNRHLHVIIILALLYAITLLESVIHVCRDSCCQKETV